MAVLDQERFVVKEARSEGSRYSVRRCLAIIVGLSLGFWTLLGVIVYNAV